MKKRARFAAAAVALMMAAVTCGVSASPAANAVDDEKISIVSPRFSTITSHSEKAYADGNKIIIKASLSSRQSTNLSIKVTVMKDGRAVDTFSSNKNGVKLTLSEQSSFEKGHVYTVKYVLNAGGEKHTVEKTVK